MKLLLIILSGVLLVSNEKNIDKAQLEAITKTKVVKQGIVPIIEKKATTKAKTTKKAQKKKKTVQNKKKVLSKSKKKVVTKKKIQKKRKKVVRTRIKYNVSEIKAYAYSLVKSYGWSDYDWECLVKLWNRESSWNPNAVNKKSGACGLGQAYPCSKATEGTDYRTNWKTQVHWGLNYIKNRYGTPLEAWKHSQDIGWY